MGADGPRWIIGTALALVLCPTPRAVAAEDAFFKGKTVTLVVGYSVGGGYDQYARALARHFGSRIPGSPNVLVQNMPGAASLTAVRYLDANAPKDGTVVTTFDPGLITESFASPDLFKVRFSDYQWIGAILRKIFNAPVRQIAGYPGSNEQRLALERGELEGNCGSWSAMPQDWLVNHKINPLVRFSPKRPPDMPESVPFISDLATTREQKDLLAVLDASAELGRPFIVAKAVPSGRVNVLRSAFQAALADAAFLAEAQAQSLPLDPVPGEEAAAIINKIYSASPELARKVKDVLE